MAEFGGRLHGQWLVRSGLRELGAVYNPDGWIYTKSRRPRTGFGQDLTLPSTLLNRTSLKIT